MSTLTTPEAPRRIGRSRKRRRTQAERSEEMRQRLITAAFEVMKRRGYSGFRIAEVHKIAGVSRGAQLHHFPTKDGLVLAALEHAFALSRRQTEQGHQSRTRAGDPFAEIIQDSKEFFFGDHFFVALDIIMSAGKNQKVRNRVVEISREQRPPAEAVWLELLHAAGIEDQAEDLLWLTVSIVRGLSIRALWQNEPKRFERLLELWREMAWLYIENKSDRRVANDRSKVRGNSALVR